MLKVLKLLVTTMLIMCMTSCKQNTLKIHIISDIHYAPRKYYEYTGKFKENNDFNGTGKQIEYQEEIIDAFINEELELKPDYIIITGDLVFSGHQKVHKAFIEKFNKLIENNIKVLVVPGNHDFDYMPFIYQKDTYFYDTMIIKEYFEDTYKDYGFLDAVSKDKDSLSYTYKLDNKTLLIALDTIAKYGNPDGELNEKTLAWISQQLEYAKKHNLNPLIVGHHNALIHNTNFDYGYRLNNSEKLVSLMNAYGATLYISGHMHIQDIENSHDVTEILNESFSLYPHRYGELLITGKNYTYNSKCYNIEKYETSTLDNLKNYNTYGLKFMHDNFGQKNLNRNLDKLCDPEVLDVLNKLNDMNCRYFMGEVINSEEVKELNNAGHNELVSSYIKSIEKHVDENNLSISGKLK